MSRTIHHVTRSNDVSPCVRIRQRYTRNPQYASRVVDRSVFPLLSTMAVGSVFAETDIASDDEIRELCSDKFRS